MRFFTASKAAGKQMQPNALIWSNSHKVHNIHCNGYDGSPRLHWILFYDAVVTVNFRGRIVSLFVKLLTVCSLKGLFVIVCWNIWIYCLMLPFYFHSKLEDCELRPIIRLFDMPFFPFHLFWTQCIYELWWLLIQAARRNSCCWSWCKQHLIHP